MNVLKRIAAVVVILVTSTGAARADDGDSVPLRFPDTPQRFEFGLYGTRPDDGDDALTVGLAYHYRLSPVFAVGARAEYAGGDLDSWVLGAPLTAHFGEGWEFVAMPGAEISDGEVKGLFRLGFGYVFEFNSFGLKPEAFADIVDGETRYGLGASVVFGF